MVFVGFSCSRLVISLGVIGLIVGGLFSADLRDTAARYIRLPAFYINSLFFIVILLSGINSTDTSQWLNFLRIKIPFLLLPFAFCGYTFFDRSFFNKILIAFVSCMFVSAVCVMIRYSMHYEEINRRIASGGIIPVPFSHIRYTLLLVFSFFCLLWLSEQRVIAMRNILFLLAAFFFTVIHILSSRSGWLALYAGLLLYFCVYIYRSRRYLIGALLFASLFALPFIFYQVIPSFHSKVSYMQYTMGQIEDGKIDDLSDAMRITSWKVGIEIIKRYPWTGVGVGDLEITSKALSKEMFPAISNDDDRKMPHNEFIWIFAAAGIFGLLLYCVAFFLPLAFSFHYHNWLFLILYIIFFSAFLTEYPLEEQVGSTFYLVFLLIFLGTFHICK